MANAITSPIQFNHQVHPRLDNDNFLIWQSQILPVIRGHGLDDFLDDSISSPSKFLVDAEGSQQLNPAFLKWRQQDQLIIAWLFNSISPPLLAQVIRCDTAASVWSTLNRLHSSQSMAKILDLKLQLQTAKKGGANCAQYLQQMQSLADRLRSIGTEISDQELVLYTLQGLGTDFDNFVTAVSLRSTPLSMIELNSLLLTHEARLLTNLRSASTTTVHLTTAPDNLNSNPSACYASNYTAQSTPPQLNFSSNYNTRGRGPRGRNNFRGRGRGRQTNPSQTNSSQESPQCQICNKWGHTALDCYHRFNIKFTSSTPSPQALLAEPAPVSSAAQSSPSVPWYIDSGASTHVTSDLNNLTAHQPYSGPDAVHIGNGSGLPIAHIGISVLSTSSRPLKLTNVLHVPSITKNLLSVSQLALDNNVVVEFSSNCCFIKDRETQRILLLGTLDKGLYQLSSVTVSSPHALHAAVSEADVWHHKLAHCSPAILDKLNKAHVIPVKASHFSVCKDCNKAKAHKVPFLSSTSCASSPLEIIHSDLWGPAPVVSDGGHRYYVLFVDEFSRFTWIYPCANKSDVPTIFAQFKAKVENLFSLKIKMFQCDGGTEFKPLMRLYPEITFQLSCPHTPEQNGLAERKHRHVVELSLACMFHASIPLQYWHFIFESVVYVINRIPSSKDAILTPFEKLFHQKPDYSMLHVLGCACYPLLRPYTAHKLEPRSELCVFLGYSTVYKGYYCLNFHTNRIYISRHVNFDDSTLPFTTTGHPPEIAHDPSSVVPLTLLPAFIPAFPSLSDSNPMPQDPHFSSSSSNSSQSSPSQNTPSSSPSTPPPPVHTMVTRTQTKSLKPKTFPQYQVYSITDTAGVPTKEPTCYTQAVKDSNWRQAMANELTALAQHSTWDLVPPPSHGHIIGAKWIFKLKLKSDGSIERHKARLVAKGYNQIEGVDFVETFSPVVKPVTIRTVLSIALSHNWSIHQLDVNNAFLHGDLQETVYMEQPPGFTDPLYPSYVCRLKKALYGLKQAPRAWFSKLKDFLLSQQFTASQSDPSLFIFKSGSILIYLLIYVDDIILTGNNTQAVQHLLTTLHSTFSLKNLDSLSYFLGIEVTTLPTGLHLSQTRYLHSILERAAMHNAKPCPTPIPTGQQLSKFAGTKLDNPQLYRSIVGALQYATITRPDLTFAVNKASQYMSEPTDLHWQLVKRILRYVRGTLSQGLLLSPSSDHSLHAYCDADWAGCPDDRRSTTGFAIYLGSNLISWSSKKQATVSRSSTEAEYRSIAVTTAEIIWLTSLLSELHFTPHQNPTIWCDNLGATFLASNPVFHARTKHIELDYHFVREQVANGRLTVRFICSNDQIGDFFTKGLPKLRFSSLCSKLHVCPNPSRLRGPVEEQNQETLDTSSTGVTGENASVDS